MEQTTYNIYDIAIGFFVVFIAALTLISTIMIYKRQKLDKDKEKDELELKEERTKNKLLEDKRINTKFDKLSNDLSDMTNSMTSVAKNLQKLITDFSVSNRMVVTLVDNQKKNTDDIGNLQNRVVVLETICKSCKNGVKHD